MVSHMQCLVVGAGPSGLTAAIELARRGIAVRVVDAVPQRPYAESRGEGLHARTLEIFERIGVLPEILDAGRILVGFAFIAGRRPIGTLSAAGLDSAHNYAVLLPQSETERILIEHLGALGVTVERPLTVEHLTSAADHLAVQLRRDDGTRETVTASYVVAADGAHSTVRKQIGVPFSGSKIQGAYVMDGEADFALAPPDDRGTFVLARGGFLVVGRRPDGSYRIALSLPSYDPRISSQRPGRGELQNLLDQFPELGVRLRSITWSSAFFISSRHVHRLRHGRIFLVGDSAHTHSPVGGQGMNTGIQDAVNLGWKLALALDGRGGQALLESYDAERMPIIRRLIASTSMSTKPLLWRNPVAVAIRNNALRLLLKTPRVQTALFDSFTGFSVSYPNSPILRQPPSGHRGPRPGQIAPETRQSRWYPRWGDDVRHQLLIFPGPDIDTHASLGWAATHDDLVRPLILTDSAMSRRYNATRGALCLVRPDGIIAASSDGDLTTLDAYADGVLTSTAE